MPQVPRYDRAVDNRALPAVKASTDLPEEAFGGKSIERVGQAGRALAQTGLDIYESEKRKADEIAIRDADISSAELASQVEMGVKQLKGKDAASAPDFVKENWNKGIDKLTPTLKNDNQRVAADRILRARRLQLDESTQIHMASEFKKYDDQQFDSAMTLYRNEGSMKYNRPGAVANSLFQQQEEIDRYAKRNNLPPEWATSAKAKAKSETYRDVLERMEVDGNHDLAKQYEKGINKFILPEDVSILEKVRKEEKVRRSERESEFERQAYLLLKDSTATDAQKLHAIDNVLRKGNIKLPQAEKMKGWVLDSFNDPEIPIEKKVSKYTNLVTAFTELEGVKTDDGGKPITPAEGNDFETISKFRQKVAAAKPYLTESQYTKLIEFTQTDFDASRAPKKNIFQGLMAVLPLLPNLNPMAQRDIVDRAMGIFDPKVAPTEAAQTIQKLKDEAVVTGNPNRTKYAIGDVIVNAKGERAEVVRYDQQTGNPVLKKMQ